MSDLEKRVDDLEVKFSYQDEFINELNKIVIDQQKKLEEITAFLKNSKISPGDDQNTSLKNERPPHY